MNGFLTIMLINALLDQFHTQGGVSLTEDISFSKTFSVSVADSVAINSLQRFPLTFSQPPLRALQQVPQANAAFLIIKRVVINSESTPDVPLGPWSWCPNGGITLTFSSPIGGGDTPVPALFGAGPVPSGQNNGLAIPVALRKVHFKTIPATVTITDLQVRPHWSATYDHLNMPVISTAPADIDLGQWYDSEFGLVNGRPVLGAATAIDGIFTTTNTSGVLQNVSYQVYGSQRASDRSSFQVFFEPSWGGSQYFVGIYDNNAGITQSFALNELIPIQITDMGMTNLGNIIFQNNFQIPFYFSSVSMNIIVTATVAYLVPAGVI